VTLIQEKAKFATEKIGKADAREEWTYRGDPIHWSMLQNGLSFPMQTPFWECWHSGRFSITRQETLPETLAANSFMTRVLPAPQAISIFLAPFAQASKQSC